MRPARERRLDLRFIVIGYTDIDKELMAIGNVEITGRYKEKDLGALLAEHDPDAALTLSLWPETFCYTFHERANLGVYPMAFDIGAPAASIKERGWGKRITLELAHGGAALLAEILATDMRLSTVEASHLIKEASYHPMMQRCYEL